MIGMILVLARKLNVHRKTKNLGWKGEILDFFFGSSEATSTTMLSISSYLVLGAWYTGEVSLSGTPQQLIPIHWTVSLFLGSAMELISPFIVNYFVNVIKRAFDPSKTGG